MRMFWSPQFMAGVAFTAAAFATVFEMYVFTFGMAALGCIHTVLFYNSLDDEE